MLPSLLCSTLLQEILQRLIKQPTLLLLHKIHHIAIPHHIQELRLLRVDRQPLSTTLHLSNRAPIAPRLQVPHVRIRIAAGPRKSSPVVDRELHKREVVGVAEGKADADYVAEVVGEVARVAFEVFVCVPGRGDVSVHVVTCRRA